MGALSIISYPTPFHSMKRLFILLIAAFGVCTVQAQTVLINSHFNTATALTDLGSLVTTGGTVTLSPTKAADGVCTQGMVQVNSAGGFLQVNVSSCSVMTFNMKSTAGARTVKVSYQKQGESVFTVLTSTLSVSTAAVFDFHTLYPTLVTTVPIMVKIEPVSGNIQIHDLYVVSNNSVSTAAEITAFSLPNQIGSATINSAAGTIAVNVPLGTSLSSVTPSVLNISPNATISPTAATARDFTNPATYTVTAQDGTTTKVWTVTVTAIASTEKEMTAFTLAPTQIGSSVINSAAGTIAVSMPLGSVLTSLMPTTLTISSLASVSPTPSVAQDFSAPVVYTVTAQNASTKTWTVTVTLVDPNATYTDYQGEDAVFTGIVATNHLNYTGTGFIDFATTGPNNATFTVCQQAAGSQTVKFRYSFAKPPPDIRTAQLLVNNVYIQDVTFPVTPTFDDWADATAIVTLNQGINSIKLYWATTDGPNLDKLSISGVQCASYTLTTSATNGGTITISPSRTNNKYFDGEQVTLTAVNAINATFANWSGDLTGSTTPSVLTMNSNKTVTANFTVVSTYTLVINKTGIGNVTASPASTGGSYAAGTVVTLTATPLLGNSFTNWTGDASGTSLTTTVTMNANKTVTGNFTSNYTFNFNKVVGYAGGPGDGFAGPTTGGQTTTQPIFCINGPAEFNKLCEALYYRQRAYAGKTPTNGMLKAPLIILIKAGVYDASQTLSAIGSNTYGNDMLDIPEQGDLTFIGEGNVTFNFGINVKRSYNIIIRNISLHSYGDDGVNIGYPETHHIWVDHCTFGHPTTYPSNSEVPDGTSEVKGGASYITISWCKYQNHHKTCLLGHSDNNGAEDRGRLKTTYFANYFLSTNSRHPRTRFGTVHVLNNMYENVGRGRNGGFGYGIGASNESQVWAEGNFFLDTRWPMSADRSVADFAAVYGPLMSQNSNIACFGLKSVNNEYDDSGLTATIVGQVKPEMINPSGMSVKFDELTGPNFTYIPSNDYNYTADLLPASAVRILVPLNAGADKMNWGVACSVIALDLVDFAAKKVNNEAVLTWQTVNEQAVSHFDVERSTDGKSFSTISEVKARNTAALNTYSLTDKGPLSTIQYYRLKMVDFDGTIAYSKTVSIAKEAGHTLKVYPSVTKDVLTVETTTLGVATLHIIDILGKTVATKQVAASENTTTTTVTVSNLPNGIYAVVFENTNGRTTAQFVKQ
jgi:pectate lyase